MGNSLPTNPSIFGERPPLQVTDFFLSQAGILLPSVSILFLFFGAEQKEPNGRLIAVFNFSAGTQQDRKSVV